MTRVVVAVAVAVGLGCGESRTSPGAGDDTPPPRPPAARKSAEPSDAAVSGVAILVDGAEVSTVPVPAPGEPVKLSTLVEMPQTEWKVVEGYATEFRTLKLRKPHQTYPDQTVMVFACDDGKPCFGLFLREDRAAADQKHLLGKPRLFVRGVSEVRIRTVEEKVERPEPSPLDVAAGDDVTRLSGQAIAALEPLSLAGMSADRPTWRLGDVIGLAGKHRFGKVIVRAEGDESLEVSAGAVADPKQLVALKLNRRGIYKLMWLDISTRPHKLLHELRGVTRVELQ